MTGFWPKKAPKNAQMCQRRSKKPENEFKTMRKQPQNDAKKMLKWSTSDPKKTPDRQKNGPKSPQKIIRKWPYMAPDRVKMDQKESKVAKNGSKVI